MLKFWRKKTRAEDLVGLSVTPDCIALARVSWKNSAPFLEQCLQSECSDSEERRTLLKRVVAEQGLEGLSCCYVLSPSDYTLHLVEAPQVAADEMKSAVRWKIRDLLDMPPEEAVIDIFPLPEDAHRGRREMLYVVATASSIIKKVAELVESSGLKLSVIDIPELALRNLSLQSASDDNGLAFMDLRSTGSTMNLSRKGKLYLTRRINTQLDDDVMASPEWETLKDRLVLEIQRSLDYYESQMGQNPISQMLIAPRPGDTEALTRSLDEAMSVRVSALDFGPWLARSAHIDEPALQSCLLPIGAALRHDPLAAAT